MIIDEESLLRYVADIQRHTKNLSRDEEAALSRRIQRGDKKALETLVTRNLRFVISVAHHYRNQGVPIAELISEGNIGLITAAKRFDHRKNIKFISYAVWWIRHHILHAIRHRSRFIRIPHLATDRVIEVNRVVDELQQMYHRDPTPAEIAQSTGLHPDYLYSLHAASARVASINAPTVTGEDATLESVLPAIEEPENPMSDILRRVLGTLSGREREIIERRYFGDVTNTLEEIARDFGCTRERVRQIEEKALTKMRYRVKALNN